MVRVGYRPVPSGAWLPWVRTRTMPPYPLIEPISIPFTKYFCING